MNLRALLHIGAVLFYSWPSVTSQDESDVQPYLIFANTVDIRQINFDGTNYAILLNNLGDVVALDYDYAEGWIYWSDHTRKKIQRAPLSGGNSYIEDFIIDNVQQPDGLAVDWLNKKLFWTDTVRGVVESCGLDKTGRTVLLVSNIYQPHGIAVDPADNWFYVTDVYSSRPAILKARMNNGSELTTLIDTDISRPVAITVDYDDRKMYWIDSDINIVERSNLDGSEREVILQGSAWSPFGLSLYEDRLYWTDIQEEHIINGNKNTGTDIVMMYGSFQRPTAIHVVHPDRQAGADTDYCKSNGGLGACQHICIDLYGSYQCDCFNGYQLEQDGATCSDINECSIGNGGCNHHCLNLDGDYQCECIYGFSLLEDGQTCVDTNECDNNNGGCQVNCSNTDSSFYCFCPSGYTLDTNSQTCSDVNECSQTQSLCPSDTTCNNSPGSYSCLCALGYGYSSLTETCEDINECLMPDTPCSQKCTNSDGSYSCECNTGYILLADGVNCSNIDECAQSAPCQHYCTDTEGSFYCTCQEGYALNPSDQTCVEITCGAPVVSSQFSVSCSSASYTYGTTCQIFCVEGSLMGTSSISCQSSGQWTLLIAECTESESSNHQPILTYLSSSQMLENSMGGDTVGFLHTIDPDVGQSFNYTLISGATNYFYVDQSDNTLKTLGNLDFETDIWHVITVRAVDSGNPPYSLDSILIIQVLDVNEPPSEPILLPNTVKESAETDSIIGQLSLADPDNGQSLALTLLSNVDGRFGLSGSFLMLLKPLNFEQYSLHQFSVQVQDNGLPSLTTTVTLTVTVLDVNEGPTSIVLNGNLVQENVEVSEGEKAIGTLVVSDPDLGDTHALTLLNDDLGCFSLNKNILTVANVVCFNFEIYPYLTATVFAMDSGGLNASSEIQVFVSDINEAPTDIVLSTSLIIEHSPIDSVVGTLSVVDPDIGDSHIIFLSSILSGFFTIKDNTLKLEKDISFEDYKDGINLTFLARDSGELMIQKTLTILVIDQNEAPSSIKVLIVPEFQCEPGHMGQNGIVIHACIPENTPPLTSIAQILAYDPDSDSLTVGIIDPSNRFIVSADENLLVGFDGLNYELSTFGSTYTFTLTATDGSGLTLLQDFSVELLDLNDAPSTVELSNLIVSGGTPPGQIFASLTCVDEDTTDDHTFTLIDDAEGKFSINGSNLQVAQDLDFWQNTVATIQVMCSDGKEESLAVTFQIDIREADTGSFLITIFPQSIEENNKPLDVIGNISAWQVYGTDPDSYIFNLLEDSGGIFKLSNPYSHQVELLSSISFDYENQSLYTLTVEVIGQSYGTVVSKTFGIFVLDANEPPKDIILHHDEVPENLEDALVGVITAQDPESVGVNFMILTDPSGAFELEDTETAGTVRLKTSKKLNFEEQLQSDLVIRAYDISDPNLYTDSQLFHINVLDVNEPPTAINLDKTMIEENALPGYRVGSLTITDPDSVHTTQQFTCILRDDAGGIFIMEDLDLKVSSTGSVDYEQQDYLMIDVECKDWGGLAYHQQFSLNVTNINEAPTDIKPTSGKLEIEENKQPGTIVDQFLTEDPDETGEDHTLTIHPSDTFNFLGNSLIAYVELNFEEQENYTVLITSTDKKGLSTSKVVTINVIDVNDPPVGITMSSIVSVAENSPSGTLVTELTTVDEDIGQSHTYRLLSQIPLDALVLNGNQLKVNNDAILDYENVKEIVVHISTTDNVQAEYLETLTIPVNDVNEIPTGIELSNNQVYERVPGNTEIGVLTVIDPDGREGVFFCLLLNDVEGRFEISNNDSQITLLVAHELALNFEKNQSHQIQIGCRDSGITYVFEDFTIIVLDANDQPANILFTDAAPTDTILVPNRPSSQITKDMFSVSIAGSQHATVSENAAIGLTIVAYMTIPDEDNLSVRSRTSSQGHNCIIITESQYLASLDDPDIAGRKRRSLNDRRVRSAFTGEEAETKFSIIAGTNDIVVSEQLDYIDASKQILYIQCTDNGSPQLSVVSQLIVYVMDVDNPPTDMILSALVIEENSSEDALVGTLEVVDPDGSQYSPVFTLETKGSPFYIVSNELRVLQPARIDHELTPDLSVQISVFDIATNSTLSKTFHIDIQDVNEPPTGITINGLSNIDVSETLTVGTILGTLIADDPDKDSAFTFSFYSGGKRSTGSFELFSIDGDQLVLVGNLNIQEQEIYQLSIEVRDSGGLGFVGVITLVVINGSICLECSPYAQCLSTGCLCSPGFEGDGKSCTDIDECEPNPCHPQNSYGNCENGIGGIRNFTCDCKDGWAQPDCSLQLDDCLNNNCDLEGTALCVDDINGYQCQCKAGFTSTLCDSNIDDCQVNPCHNEGVCVDVVNGYRCECSQPFIGINCETDNTPCLDVNCPNKGVCIPYPDGLTYSCWCLEPYAENCEGCAYGYGGSECLPCQPPLTGENCLIDSSICDIQPCPSFGTCVPTEDNSYYCICTGNLTMSSCESENEIAASSQTDQTLTSTTIYIIVAVAIFIVVIIFIIIVAFYCTKYRRMPKELRSGRATVRYDDHDQVFLSEFSPESAEDHHVSNPVYFDYEGVVGEGITLHSSSIGLSPQAISHLNRVAATTNPLNNIVSIKIDNDLRSHAQQQQQQESPPQVEGATAAEPRYVTVETMAKNNLGAWERKLVNQEEEEDLKKKDEKFNNTEPLPSPPLQLLTPMEPQETNVSIRRERVSPTQSVESEEVAAAKSGESNTTSL